MIVDEKNTIRNTILKTPPKMRKVNKKTEIVFRPKYGQFPFLMVERLYVILNIY